MLYDTLPIDFSKARMARLEAVKCTDSWPNWRITSWHRSCAGRTDQRPKYIDACVVWHNPNVTSVHRLRFWRHGPISLMTCGEKASLNAMDTMVMLGATDHGGCKLCRDVVACVRAARGIQHVYMSGRVGNDFVTAYRHMVGDEYVANKVSVTRARMNRDDAAERMRHDHPRTHRVLTAEAVKSYYFSLLREAVRRDPSVVEAGYNKYLYIRVMADDHPVDTMLCSAQSGVYKSATGRTHRSKWDKRLDIGLPLPVVRNLVARGLLSVAGRVLGGIVGMSEQGDRMVAWAIKWGSPVAETHWHQAVFVRPDGHGAWAFDSWVRGGAR